MLCYLIIHNCPLFCHYWAGYQLIVGLAFETLTINKTGHIQAAQLAPDGPQTDRNSHSTPHTRCLSAFIHRQQPDTAASIPDAQVLTLPCGQRWAQIPGWQTSRARLLPPLQRRRQQQLQQLGQSAPARVQGCPSRRERGSAAGTGTAEWCAGKTGKGNGRTQCTRR